MAFSPATRGRSWMITFQIANMKNAGWEEGDYLNPEWLGQALTHLWEESGNDRTCGVAVCRSKEGLYHAHVAAYGNTTTLLKVSKIFFSAHVEPQMGGKKELTAYLKKEGKYAEKEEEILFLKNIDAIQDVQGQRTDLKNIEDMLNQGFSPLQIMETNFSYRKYEKIIKSAYIDKRVKEMPLIKEMHNEWHVGESGSGKTYYYYQLCEKYTPEKIYLTSDYEGVGNFDYYISQGAPPILFIDEFRGNMKYSQLLTLLDKYSRSQTHCRFSNTYNLWTTCIITSVLSPDEAYERMVSAEERDTDKIDQLLRRLDLIVYHYKEKEEFKSFSIPASEYVDYEELKQRALGGASGFVELSPEDTVPFDVKRGGKK